MVDRRVQADDDPHLDLTGFPRGLLASNYNRNYLLWSTHFINSGDRTKSADPVRGPKQYTDQGELTVSRPSTDYGATQWHVLGRLRANRPGITPPSLSHHPCPLPLFLSLPLLSFFLPTLPSTPLLFPSCWFFFSSFPLPQCHSYLSFYLPPPPTLFSPISLFHTPAPPPYSSSYLLFQPHPNFYRFSLNFFSSPPPALLFLFTHSSPLLPFLFHQLSSPSSLPSSSIS